MAQAIVLLCDVHLNEQQERVDAETYEWNGVEFDLCDACLDYPIRTLNLIARDYGRKPNGKPKKAKKPAPVATPAYDDEDDLTCPHGCNGGKPFKSAQGKRMHLTMKHKDGA